MPAGAGEAAGGDAADAAQADDRHRLAWLLGEDADIADTVAAIVD